MTSARTRTGDSASDGGGEAARTGAPWRSATAALLWVCVLAGAGLLGAWALTHAGPDADAHVSAPLDDAGVRHELARERTAAPPPTSRPGTPKGPPARATAEAVGRGSVHFEGGSASAECRPDPVEGQLIYLVSWSPATGFGVEEVERGPGPVASVEMEPDSGDEDDQDDITTVLTCTDAGRPVVAPDQDVDD
ncbi:hypothetical protein [Streptomyces himastatinicus]|uniref:hypothetical protein n=1 Tax=Streptomyces himastatinicus TaxID=998084 RepID=UPI0001B502A0|nr:hypothetical protein [Streptomyces himastatinicus]